jgi:hypothetical protein
MRPFASRLGGGAGSRVGVPLPGLPAPQRQRVLGGVAQLLSVTTDKMRRLALARRLYSIGVEQSQATEPTAGLADHVEKGLVAQSHRRACIGNLRSSDEVRPVLRLGGFKLRLDFRPANIESTRRTMLSQRLNHIVPLFADLSLYGAARGSHHRIASACGNRKGAFNYFGIVLRQPLRAYSDASRKARTRLSPAKRTQ